MEENDNNNNNTPPESDSQEALPPGMKEAIARYRPQMQRWVLEKRNAHFPLERQADGSLRWVNRAERRKRKLR